MKTRPYLNELSEKIFEANKEKGFHDEELSNETLLMLVITELSEAVEADRKGKRTDDKALIAFQNNDKIFMSSAFDLMVKDTLEDELADTIIRILDLAGLRRYKIKADYRYNVSNKTIPEHIFDICGSVIRTIENDDIGRHIYFTIIMIESICHHLGIDIWLHVELKMKYNLTRPYKHGKSY